MALIKKTSIEEVVAAADMVDVVQGRTQLRKSGARWVGLCPFHSEKTPSFGINPVEKLFYCHGCHKGGTICRVEPRCPPFWIWRNRAMAGRTNQLCNRRWAVSRVSSSTARTTA